MSNMVAGDTICADMKAKGYRPAWMEATDDRIAIGFEIISAKPNWTKAFHCEAAVADPPAFEMMIKEWKAKVRREIAIAMPSETVQRLLAIHGLPVVMKALA